MNPITGIDHVVVAVRDLERAAAIWARLGFTISPRGLHSAHMGTANHTVMLEVDDYFELIAVHAPTERNQKRRDFLSIREGASDIAFASPNSAAVMAAWRARGFKAGDLLNFQRPVARPDGTMLDAKFAVTDLPQGALPGANAFCCGHLTREAVWLPELLQHANGARAIRRVTMLSPDPAATAAEWARALDARLEDFGQTAVIGRHRIECLTAPDVIARFGRLPDKLGPDPGIAGIGFTVADTDAACASLTDNSVPFMLNANSVVVDAAHATGVMVEFIA